MQEPKRLHHIKYFHDWNASSLNTRIREVIEFLLTTGAALCVNGLAVSLRNAMTLLPVAFLGGPADGGQVFWSGFSPKQDRFVVGGHFAVPAEKALKVRGKSLFGIVVMNT